MYRSETSFSVVIPCYNSELYIERCLDSIKNNNYEKVEIIIINDNSKDNTESIIKEYIDTHHELNIIYEKNDINIGAGKSRNKGINLSSGDYITFVDADDTVDYEMFSTLSSIADTKDCDCIIFNAKILNSNGKKHFDMFYGGGYSKSCEIPLTDALVYTKGCTCGKAYKNEIIKKNCVKFADLKRNEDLVYTKTALSCCNSVYFINKALYNYIENSKSLMQDVSLLDKNNAFKAYEIISHFFEGKKFADELNSIYLIEVVYSTTMTSIRKRENAKSNYKSMIRKYIKDDYYFKGYDLKYRIILLLFKLQLFGVVSTIV